VGRAAIEAVVQGDPRHETMPSRVADETVEARGKQDVASPSDGLSSDEARARLEKSGPNEVPDTSMRPWRMALAKFWAPVPWMLEAAVILQLVLREYAEAAVIAGLLVFNAALGFFQEGRAQATLAALKSRLALTATVRRDGAWKSSLQSSWCWVMR
jgi:H+-transporting ATPase